MHIHIVVIFHPIFGAVTIPMDCVQFAYFQHYRANGARALEAAFLATEH